MKPYYDDGTVTIYHGDAREFIGAIRADLVVTDPPYGIGLVSKRNADYRVKGFSAKGLPPASVLYKDDREHVEQLIAAVVSPLLARIGRGVVFPGPKMLFAYPEPASIGTVWTRPCARRRTSVAARSALSPSRRTARRQPKRLCQDVFDLGSAA
jgi:hypothetical protein